MICNYLKNAAIFIVFILLVSGCISHVEANRDYNITKPITPDKFKEISVKACKRAGLGTHSLSAGIVETQCNTANYFLSATMSTDKDMKTVKSIDVSVRGHSGTFVPGRKVSDVGAAEIADNYLKALKTMIEEN